MKNRDIRKEAARSGLLDIDTALENGSKYISWFGEFFEIALKLERTTEAWRISHPKETAELEARQETLYRSVIAMGRDGYGACCERICEFIDMCESGGAVDEATANLYFRALEFIDENDRVGKLMDAGDPAKGA
ncbi:MAG: hypothetical protein ABFD84_17020 [Candidatus Polarisedimenticolia bacterium]|nr:hypothetical protein [bacterium]